MKQPIKAGAILMDIPWPGMGGEKHYRTLSLQKILALPVTDFAAENSHLYLWVPNSLIATGVRVAETYGYTVRNVITWVKNRPSRPTRYLQPNTELLLFCTRGDAPARVLGQPTVIMAPVELHSQKPAEQYAVISRLSTPPFLEMFARARPALGDWLVWGDELPDSDISIPGYPTAADFTEEAA